MMATKVAPCETAVQQQQQAGQRLQYPSGECLAVGTVCFVGSVKCAASTLSTAAS